MSSGRGPGELLRPWGLVIDNDMVYLRNTFLRRILKFDILETERLIHR